MEPRNKLSILRKARPRAAIAKGCLLCLLGSLAVYCSHNMFRGCWQVNGYVVNLCWAFDTHKQEKKTLNFRGSILSHKGNTLRPVGVRVVGGSRDSGTSRSSRACVGAAVLGGRSGGIASGGGSPQWLLSPFP